MERGAKVIKEPWEESDENGKVTFASIQTVCYIIPSYLLTWPRSSQFCHHAIYRPTQFYHQFTSHIFPNKISVLPTSFRKSVRCTSHSHPPAPPPTRHGPWSVIILRCKGLFFIYIALLFFLIKYGEVNHTFVERKDYSGDFLPGYKKQTLADPILKNLYVHIICNCTYQ